ncbi:hypothetical protein B0J17DRAFT_211496 [Rhizoctonia solani]|nr:hypothetical protein B0J17DRAFT_211496 [Rhizoctonia solani]
MKVVVDEKGQPFASSEYLIEAMDWLVRDVLPGDRLFFMFSGHCEPPAPGRSEAHLVAADLMTVPRSTFQERLIGKVPAGAELTIVLDCCNAAGMVKLKYCVGKMEYKPEIKHISKPPVSTRGFPQQGSLHGLNNVGYQAPAPLSNKTPAMVNPASFGTLVSTPPHMKRGMAAAPPLPSAALATQAQAPGLMTSLVGSTPGMSGPALTFSGIRPGPAQRRQLVVEGRPLPYFEERQAGFVAPAGKIIVWAGTGELQKAFESSKGVDNGIVTDAFCNVLEKSLNASNTNATLRDLWHSVVGSIDRENGWRSERDARKDKKPAPNLRVQCAQLLVSQQDVLHSSSPILNQLVC